MMVLQPTRRALFAAGAAMLLERGAARAQEPGRIYRLGILSNYPREAPIWAALLGELSKYGFAEARNLSVDSEGL